MSNKADPYLMAQYNQWHAKQEDSPSRRACFFGGYETAQADVAGLLDLVYRIRKAADDPTGALMQDELVARIAELQQDAECFRFWVSEAARSPSAIAKLIHNCTTEQDYRDVLLPAVNAARAAIKAAKDVK